MPLLPEKLKILVKRAVKEARRIDSGSKDTVIRLVLDEYGKNFYITKEEVMDILKESKFKLQ